jgi:hypothetical protein
MTAKQPNPQGDAPRSEPEIIPPGHRGPDTPRMRVVLDAERMHFMKHGTLGTILMALITGLLLAVMLIMLAGAFVIFLPVILLFVTAAFVAGLLRIYFQPPP